MYEYRTLSVAERANLRRQRRELGYPKHSPPRFDAEGRFFLLTAACYEHRPLMSTAERRNTLLDALFDQFVRRDHDILSWVVLPNHYHLLVEVAEPVTISEVFKLVHGRLSFTWNGEEGTRGRKVWHRFSDRAMRSLRHFYTTLNYIHTIRPGMAMSPLRTSGKRVAFTGILRRVAGLGCATCG